MWKKIAVLAATSLATLLAKTAWDRRQRDAKGGRAPHREAVQRWEDDGGLVPSVPAQTPATPDAAKRAAPQRRRSPRNAATKTAAKSRPLQTS